MLRLCAFADEYNPSLDKQTEGLKKHGIRLIEFRAVDGKNVADLDDEEAKACYVILKSIKDRDTVLTLEPHLTLFEGYKNIDGTEMKHKFSFDRTEEAFDFAVKSLKELLEKCGYKEGGEGYLPE